MAINEKFQLALEHYRVGNLQQAESICKDILKIQLNNADALQLLGLIYYQFGNYDLAIEYIKKALQFNPTNADAYCNIGIAFQAKNQFDVAIICYQKALQLNPDHATSYINLGNVLQEKGQLDEAISTYQKVLQLNPTNADAYYNLGTAFQDKKQLDEAITCYQKALQLNQSFVDAYVNLGIILQEKGQLYKAITFYKKAIELNPNDADVYYNLGRALQEKGQLVEAMTHFQKAIECNPNIAGTFNNLGTSLQEDKQLDEIITRYKKAIELNPNNAGIYNILGIAFQEKGQFDEALTCFQKAIELDPNFTDAYWNMSLIQLLFGNFKVGWKGFEWRSKIRSMSYQLNFSQPLWNGTDIKGLTILLLAEYGLGDTIQFIRYAPLVAQRCAKVIVECQKELTSLLQNVEGIYQVIAYGSPLPKFDVYCTLLSLPLIFDTTLESIPANIPYISLDSLLVQKWRNKVQHNNSKLKIGLVWAGGFPQKKSCALEVFSPLAQFGDIILYSLQKGEAAEHAKNPPKGMKLIDYTEDIRDFSDTAALIENLDLVISVDTAVAHLAGALGKPVWTLIPFAPDWRWLLNREDSPWYPTMRLFRQPSPGDWKPVVARIEKDLNEFNELPRSKLRGI